MDNYPSGTRVRINARRGFLELRSDLWQYDNLTGAIISSAEVTRYQIHSWEGDWHTPSEVVQAYKIHLDIGIEAHNVIEECLEPWKAPACAANHSV